MARNGRRTKAAAPADQETSVSEVDAAPGGAAEGASTDPISGNPAQREADKRYSENRAQQRLEREERREERAARHDERFRGVTQGASADAPPRSAGGSKIKVGSPYKPLPGVQDVGGVLVNRPFGSDSITRPSAVAGPEPAEAEESEEAEAA